MLNGLDDVPWSSLTHAYGDASDVPEILRALAAGDREAIGELFGNIWHQGTVYEATAPAVPFLIELLDAEDAERPDLLALLQAIASGSSYLDVHADLGARSGAAASKTIERELGWVRAASEAVHAGSPVYLRLLGEGDEETRIAAAHTLSACVRAADLIAPRLLEHIEQDESGAARASMIFAMRALSSVPESARGWLAHPDSAVRVAASLVLLSDAHECDEEIAQVLEHSTPLAIETLTRVPAAGDAGEPLRFVMNQLSDCPSLQARLLGAWTQHVSADVRKGAVFATEDVMRASRSATAELVPVLARCLSDPDRDVRYWAASHLASVGPAAAGAQNELRALLDREPLAANAPSSFALHALCAIESPAVVQYLREKLESVAPAPGAWGRVQAAFARPTELPPGMTRALDAIGPWATRCLEPLVRLIPVVPEGNTKIALIEAVGRFGPAASIAVPAIRGELRDHPHIATRVLGDLGLVAAPALGDLQRMVDHEDPYVRINAARAVWRITGSTMIALAVLRDAITTGERHERSHALEVVAEIGPAAATLADLLPPLFDSDDDWLSSRSLIAWWYLEADAERVVPLLVSRHIEPVPRGREVVRCLGDMGPAAHLAIPRLRAAVDSERRWVLSDGSVEWRDLCAEALTRIEGTSDASA